MSKRTNDLGKRGEKTAERFLNSRGLVTIDRNWRDGRVGEIDLILRDQDRIVFVEVRTRSGGPSAVQEVVSPQKLGRLRRLAAAWLSKQAGYAEYRIDLVGIAPRRGRADADLFWWKGIDR